MPISIVNKIPPRLSNFKSMTKQTILLFIVFILAIVYKQLNVVQAFQCYVCDSKFNIECTEKLPQTTKLIAQDCKNITGAKYCVKTTNIYAGE